MNQNIKIVKVQRIPTIKQHDPIITSIAYNVQSFPHKKNAMNNELLQPYFEDKFVNVFSKEQAIQLYKRIKFNNKISETKPVES